MRCRRSSSSRSVSLSRKDGDSLPPSSAFPIDISDGGGLVFGLPPLNQYDAAATDLRDMFTSPPDYTPYDFTQILYTKGASPVWIAASKGVDFSRPDADEVKLRNAIIKSEGLPRPIAPAPSRPRN